MIEDKKKSVEDEDRAREQDDYLDEALKETFPASDPISPGHPENKNLNKLYASSGCPAANSGANHPVTDMAPHLAEITDKIGGPSSTRAQWSATHATWRPLCVCPPSYQQMPQDSELENG